jgi:hypothetical protein
VIPNLGLLRLLKSGIYPADTWVKFPCEYWKKEAPTVRPPGDHGVAGGPATARVPGLGGEGSVTLTSGV